MGVYVPWLVDAARLAAKGTDWTVVVWPGWERHGHGPMRLVEGVVGHHTATPETAPGDYPSANVVRLGRSGLAGPLAQYGLGRRREIHVFAAGLAYHAGASAFAGYTDLNDEFIGIEAENSGNGRWSDAALFMYPRLVGACLIYMRRGVDRYASHRTVARPAGRKPDPAGISDAWMRDRAAQFMAGDSKESKENDVELTDRFDQSKIRLQPGTVGHAMLGTWQFARGARIAAEKNTAELAGLRVAVDKLAGAVAGDDLTADELRAAVKSGVAEALAEGTVKVDIDVTGVQG